MESSKLMPHEIAVSLGLTLDESVGVGSSFIRGNAFYRLRDDAGLLLTNWDLMADETERDPDMSPRKEWLLFGMRGPIRKYMYLSEGFLSDTLPASVTIDHFITQLDQEAKKAMSESRY